MGKIYIDFIQGTLLILIIAIIYLVTLGGVFVFGFFAFINFVGWLSIAVISAELIMIILFSFGSLSIKNGEVIIHKSVATHRKLVFSVDGTLFLTNERLIFISGASVPNCIEFPIKGLKCKLYMPLSIRDGITIESEDRRVNFGVFSPEKWLQLISKAQDQNQRRMIQ